MTASWVVQAQSQETGQTHRISRGVNGAIIGGLFGFPVAGPAIGGLSNTRREGVITVTWLRLPEISEEGKAAVDLPAAEAPSVDENVIGKLKKLAELRDAGILTEDEFQNKKTDLLGRL